MSVDSKMTAIADKIRGLLGLSGDMGLDAMATNLTTEQANITAALSALAEKGVTVPAGANSNALAGLIAAIEAGGGKINGKAYACGTIILSETPTEDIVITHDSVGAGTINTGMLYFTKGLGSIPDDSLVMAVQTITKTSGSTACGITYSSYT